MEGIDAILLFNLQAGNLGRTGGKMFFIAQKWALDVYEYNSNGKERINKSGEAQYN